MSKKQSLSNNTLLNYFTPIKTGAKSSEQSNINAGASTTNSNNLQTTPKTPKRCISGDNSSGNRTDHAAATTSKSSNGQNTQKTPKRRIWGDNSSDNHTDNAAAGTPTSGNRQNTQETSKPTIWEIEEIKPFSSRKRRFMIIPDSSDESTSDDENKDTGNTPKRVNLNKFKKEASGTPPAKRSRLAREIYTEEVAHCSRAAPSTVTSEIVSTLSQGQHNRWPHTSYPFMLPRNIRDAEKRSPDDPDYDPRSLYIPSEFKKGLTPAMRQWWELKGKNMDTVLFFKVGKFYELYHMDAVIGVQELGFSYMKGEFAHSGFPETAYGKMSSALLELGYKVARVEQTETPDMMEERNKRNKGGKHDKVVRREICQISTKATIVYGPMQDVPKYSQSLYLCALTEKRVNEKTIFGAYHRFGLCFVDTTIGVLHLAEFNDDKQCSRLLSLFATYTPGLFLLERHCISEHVLDKVLPLVGNVTREMLQSGTQFYSSSETLKRLREADFFKDKFGNFSWPSGLRPCIDPSDSLEETCTPSYQMAVSALGACLHHLTYSELAIQLFSMAKVEIYRPLEMGVEGRRRATRGYMVIDGISVHNLKLLGGKGTLQKTLDHCVTPFAKRALPSWICRPLCNTSAIADRQNAVFELLQDPNRLAAARDVLKTLPDFERAILRLHTFGNRLYATQHPDSRAVFYESKTYEQRKIVNFLSTLNGFQGAQQLQTIFQKFDSALVKKLTQLAEFGGEYIDDTEIIQTFKDKFDFDAAVDRGQIIPKKGEDCEYDQVQDDISSLKSELDAYLKEQCKYFGTKIVYFGTDKKRFQLEVPEKACNRVTSEYQLESSKRGNKTTSGVKRYITAQTKHFLVTMMALEGKREKILADVNRRIFEKFATYYDTWQKNTESIKTLDILCSLAVYAKSESYPPCRPSVYDFDKENPRLHIEDGRHPCIEGIEDYVPNDTVLGGDNDRVLVLTGPNMGGKSTLMRQVALLTIMAQMGCLVPAKNMTMTLVERIFTRIGAGDDILSGRSTFMVELTEAASILRYSNESALLLIDELGRGTSTLDGISIATAYMNYLQKTACRTIFSTHYYKLVDTFLGTPGIQFGHMACMVENEDDEASERNVTFLYKLVEGRCPKSYGFFAARLAGLPNAIVGGGQAFSKWQQRTDARRQITKTCLQTGDVQALREKLLELKTERDSLLLS